MCAKVREDPDGTPEMFSDVMKMLNGFQTIERGKEQLRRRNITSRVIYDKIA